VRPKGGEVREFVLRLRLTRPPIGEALAEHIGGDLLGAVHIGEAEPDAMVVAEIEFRAVAVQVGF